MIQDLLKLSKVLLPTSAFISVALSPHAILAGVSNIKRMYQTRNGDFRVICLNNKSETVDPKKILNNSVCEGKTNTNNAKVICIRDEFFNKYYVTRVSDGKRISGRISSERCKQITQASKRNLVCGGDDGFFDKFYVMKISDGERIGSKLSSQLCMQVIQASNRNAVCTGDEFFDHFYVTRISDGKRVSSRLPSKRCKQITTEYPNFGVAQ